MRRFTIKKMVASLPQPIPLSLGATKADGEKTVTYNFIASGQIHVDMKNGTQQNIHASQWKDLDKQAIKNAFVQGWDGLNEEELSLPICNFIKGTIKNSCVSEDWALWYETRSRRQRRRRPRRKKSRSAKVPEEFYGRSHLPPLTSPPTWVG